MPVYQLPVLNLVGMPTCCPGFTNFYKYELVPSGILKYEHVLPELKNRAKFSEHFEKLKIKIKNKKKYPGRVHSTAVHVQLYYPDTH